MCLAQKWAKKSLFDVINLIDKNDFALKLHEKSFFNSNWYQCICLMCKHVKMITFGINPFICAHKCTFSLIMNESYRSELLYTIFCLPKYLKLSFKCNLKILFLLFEAVNVWVCVRWKFIIIAFVGWVNECVCVCTCDTHKYIHSAYNTTGYTHVFRSHF